jgi:hypothetical protein
MSHDPAMPPAERPEPSDGPFGQSVITFAGPLACIQHKNCRQQRGD